jgi:hypothetical protein
MTISAQISLREARTPGSAFSFLLPADRAFEAAGLRIGAIAPTVPKSSDSVLLLTMHMGCGADYLAGLTNANGGVGSEHRRFAVGLGVTLMARGEAGGLFAELTNANSIRCVAVSVRAVLSCNLARPAYAGRCSHIPVTKLDALVRRVKLYREDDGALTGRQGAGIVALYHDGTCSGAFGFGRGRAKGSSVWRTMDPTSSACGLSTLLAANVGWRLEGTAQPAWSCQTNSPLGRAQTPPRDGGVRTCSRSHGWR